MFSWSYKYDDKIVILMELNQTFNAICIDTYVKMPSFNTMQPCITYIAVRWMENQECNIKKPTHQQRGSLYKYTYTW